MRERWILQTKHGDVQGLAKQLKIPALVTKCMINRDLTNEKDMKKYLYGTLEDLYDPYLMKDMKEAVEHVLLAKQKGYKVAIASDFDCDGIFSAYILWSGFQKIGLDSKIFTPDRVMEGYGLNQRIVDEAVSEGRRLLVTCDNGIAAHEEVCYAKEKGMEVLVTDHHEIQESLPEADEVLDPKRPDETYPFDGLCGAGVAFKLICALYDRLGIPASACEDLLEYVAIATVADVMELKDENRILVKTGLNNLQNPQNIGIASLIEVLGLSEKTITAGHIGFMIGPCFNAAGRIATVEDSFSLLMEENPGEAKEKAEHLKAINDERKEMTEQGVEKAILQIEKKASIPTVLVLLLSDVHESLAGIIAGRIRERYYRPTIVFTEPEPGIVKGSGRSIPEYDMFRELMKCKPLMMRFGGHKMAAGMTMKKANLDILGNKLNQNITLTDDQLRPTVWIDASMPIGYPTIDMIKSLSMMEPFGVGNPQPIFAEQHFRILRGRKLGKEGNVLRLRIANQRGEQADAVMLFGVEEFESFIYKEWGELNLKKMYQAQSNDIDIAFTYYPMINEYQGMESIQMRINSYCRIQ